MRNHRFTNIRSAVLLVLATVFLGLSGCGGGGGSSTPDPEPTGGDDGSSSGGGDSSSGGGSPTADRIFLRSTRLSKPSSMTGRISMVLATFW